MQKQFGKTALMLLLFVFGVLNAQAQNYSLKMKLVDKSSGEPVGYATVALTPDGKTDVLKYTQSDDQGLAEIKGIPAGTYKVAAILMGYENYEEVVTINKDTDLGTKQMKVEANFLKGATVSDVGNPIIVKKDTITHNVTLIKSGDNDVLEDLLKKPPGIEVSSDGSITANGKTINKIKVGGKQFFLDDPSIASKNLPANIIESVSVIDEKSEQAQFTGIDDGEEETILDLGIRKGMMNGWFGNMMGGGGYDCVTRRPRWWPTLPRVPSSLSSAMPTIPITAVSTIWQPALWAVCEAAECGAEWVAAASVATASPVPIWPVSMAAIPGMTSLKSPATPCSTATSVTWKRPLTGKPRRRAVRF